MKLNLDGIICNIRHVNGQIIGLCILRPLGLRFDKEHRGQHKIFCHVAANMAADIGFVRPPFCILT